MPVTLANLLLRLLGLSQTLHAWKTSLASLEAARREKVACYADAVAATLARAATALGTLETSPDDHEATRETVRELGRIAGYVEDMVAALETHLDGRKLAGAKRRLDGLLPAIAAPAGATFPTPLRPDPQRIERLAEAEGYIRALADSLRA
jgi:hypothetical protein